MRAVQLIRRVSPRPGIRITLGRYVEVALGIGRRNETQRGVRQPVLLDCRETLAHLVGDGGDGIADDFAQILHGGDFATHGYIMLD
jgi:hypothetical protein